MSGGKRGLTEGWRAESHRHICTSLIPSAVFSPGTLTTTAVHQEAVMSFGCCPNTILIDTLIDNCFLCNKLDFLSYSVLFTCFAPR